MKRVFASLFVVGLAACQPPQPGDETGTAAVADPAANPANPAPHANPAVTTEAPTPGIGLDVNWVRLGGPPPAARDHLIGWFANHPRLMSVPASNLRNFLDGLGAVSGRPHNPVGTAPFMVTNPNWSFAQQANINSSAAIWLANGSAQDATNDRVYFEGAGDGSSAPAHYVAIASGIYTATPTILNSAALDSQLDGSALLLSLDGTRVFATTSNGTVYSIKTTDGTIAWQFALPAKVSWSTPWVDFTQSAVFVGDQGGNITALNASTGAKLWQTNISAKGIHSSPLVLDTGSARVLWVGADDGKIYRLDPSTGALIGSAINACRVPSGCTAQDQIWSGASVGFTDPNYKLLFTVNKRILQFNANPGSCDGAGACDFTSFAIDETNFASHQAVVYNSPIFDAFPPSFVYIGFDNRIWRAPYSDGISGSFVRGTTDNATGILRGWNSLDNGYPKSQAVFYNGEIYVGDGGAVFHRFDASSFSEAARKDFGPAVTPSPTAGPAIDSTPFLDIFAGNTYFAVKSPQAPLGTWVSLPTTFDDETPPAGGNANKLRVEVTAEAHAGQSYSVTVTALDVNNSVSGGYTGTVHFTSSDTAAGLPGSYTFVAGDAGSHTFSGLAFNTGGNQTLTATDNTISGVATVAVAAGTIDHFDITASVNTVGAGTPFNLFVRARDAAGNQVSAYTGTVHFTSSDGAATLPVNYTFTAANAGYEPFFNLTRLRTPGSQTITVSDTANPSITGTVTVNVNVGAAVSFTVVPSTTTPTSGTPFNVTVTAKDAGGNIATGYAGTVHFTSSDAQAVLPANSTLSSGTGTFTLTLKTNGSQGVTATDTVNSTIKGSTTVTVSSAGLDHFDLTSSTSTPSSGVAFDLFVRARDATGNLVTSYTGTVHFTSTDGTATLPINYTFIAVNAGYEPFWGLTRLRAQGAQSITVSDTVQTTATGTANFTVAAPPATTHFLITPAPSPVAHGTFFTSVQAKALDATNTLVTGYRGTVHWTSSDLAAVLPVDHTYTAGNAGITTWYNSIKLNTVGVQTITLTDTANNTIVGSATITVN